MPKSEDAVAKVADLSKLSGVDALAALNQIVEGARECITVHEVESSKRARLQAYETVEVARIRAGEAVLRDYFSRVFAERRYLYEEMFARLDVALEKGNAEVLHSVVVGIVDIAKSSPLAAMGDLGQIRQALDDPNQVWDL